MRLAGRVVYHLHSLGAAGAASTNTDPSAATAAGDGLRRLEPWLDHVADLGCGAVLLTPIFVAATHGYDTIDPFRIDQRLGDDGAFASFSAACRERDLLLLLDGVFNHVGRGFGPFADVIEHGSASPFAEWFRLDFTGDDGDGFGYRCFEGHRDLVALDHRSPAVLDWAVDVACHWLDRGADGWRLDVAYAIPPAFLAAFCDRVRARHPQAFVFGEMIHGDYAELVRAGHLDSVTQYELYKATWSALNDANFFELAWALKRHRVFAASFPPVTFVGNHDVSRIVSRLRDPRHLGAAVAVLMTVPGVPCVYYGDELAWTGEKGEGAGADDPMRGPLPDDPAPATDAAATARRLHRTFIALRRQRPWLTTADVEVDEVANTRLVFTTSDRDDPSRRLRTVVETAAAPVDVPSGWRPIVQEDGVAVCEPA